MCFFLPDAFFTEAGFASFEPGFPEKLFVFYFGSLYRASYEHSLLFHAVEMSALQRQLSDVIAGKGVPDAATLLKGNIASQSQGKR